MNTFNQPGKIDGDAVRREWAAHSGDWTFQLIKFLQGRRVNEVSGEEIVKTLTYARCDELERAALLWVANQAENRRPLSGEDRRMLIERDDFLMRWIAGTTLGHGDWVAELRNVPAAVRRAQEVDRALFRNSFPSPDLFGWLQKAR
jgi:hypothetical protein